MSFNARAINEQSDQVRKQYGGFLSMRRRMNLFIVCAIVIGISGLASSTCLAEGKINLQALMAKRVPILLEFGRGWCKPCKYMKPILEDVSKAYTGKAIITTVDMDANKDLVQEFKIRMMPTQVFLLPDGKEFFRNEGTLERDQIAQVFAKMGLGQPGVQGAVPGQFPQAAATQAPTGYAGAAR
jgi:thioredoxin 1